MGNTLNLICGNEATNPFQFHVDNALRNSATILGKQRALRIWLLNYILYVIFVK